MFRLSLLLRRPVHELMEMPAWALRGYAQYLAKLPAPDERIEFALANLACMYGNTHRKPGSSPRKLGEFMLFKQDPWKAEADEESGMAVFNSFAAALMER